MFERLADGVLPFFPARDHCGDFGESVPDREIVYAIVEVGLRNGQDDLMDTGGRLKGTKRMDDDGVHHPGTETVWERPPPSATPYRLQAPQRPHA